MLSFFLECIRCECLKGMSAFSFLRNQYFPNRVGFLNGDSIWIIKNSLFYSCDCMCFSANTSLPSLPLSPPYPPPLPHPSPWMSAFHLEDDTPVGERSLSQDDRPDRECSLIAQFTTAQPPSESTTMAPDKAAVKC